MAQIQDKFKEIVSEIEKRIENKEELDFIKDQISKISTLFLDEIDKIIDMNTQRMEDIAINQKILNDKIEHMQETINHIEKDIYMEEECDFEIVCPYCNNEFVEDFSNEVKTEVECPECHNIIELDWNHDEHCTGECECCLEEECNHEEDEENEDEDM